MTGSTLPLEVVTLVKADGRLLAYTQETLSRILGDLRAGNQNYCLGASGAAFMRAAPAGLLLLDVDYGLNRRLTETFQASQSATAPFGIVLSQGAASYTVSDAYAALGYAGSLGALGDVYAAFWEQADTAKYLLEGGDGSLVKSGGLFGSQAASLKTLAASGELSLTSTADEVQLSVAPLASAGGVSLLQDSRTLKGLTAGAGISIQDGASLTLSAAGLQASSLLPGYNVNISPEGQNLRISTGPLLSAGSGTELLHTNLDLDGNPASQVVKSLDAGSGIALDPTGNVVSVRTSVPFANIGSSSAQDVLTGNGFRRIAGAAGVTVSTLPDAQTLEVSGSALETRLTALEAAPITGNSSLVQHSVPSEFLDNVTVRGVLSVGQDSSNWILQARSDGIDCNQPLSASSLTAPEITSLDTRVTTLASTSGGLTKFDPSTIDYSAQGWTSEPTQPRSWELHWFTDGNRSLPLRIEDNSGLQATTYYPVIPDPNDPSDPSLYTFGPVQYVGLSAKPWCALNVSGSGQILGDKGRVRPSSIIIPSTGIFQVNFSVPYPNFDTDKPVALANGARQDGVSVMDLYWVSATELTVSMRGSIADNLYNGNFTLLVH